MLLVFGAPCQHSLLAGREHGRTVPLPDHLKSVITLDRVHRLEDHVTLSELGRIDEAV